MFYAREVAVPEQIHEISDKIKKYPLFKTKPFSREHQRKWSSDGGRMQ